MKASVPMKVECFKKRGSPSDLKMIFAVPWSRNAIKSLLPNAASTSLVINAALAVALSMLMARKSFSDSPVGLQDFANRKLNVRAFEDGNLLAFEIFDALNARIRGDGQIGVLSHTCGQ